MGTKDTAAKAKALAKHLDDLENAGLKNAALQAELLSKADEYGRIQRDISSEKVTVPSARTNLLRTETDLLAAAIRYSAGLEERRLLTESYPPTE